MSYLWSIPQAVITRPGQWRGISKRDSAITQAEMMALAKAKMTTKAK